MAFSEVNLIGPYRSRKHQGPTIRRWLRGSARTIFREPSVVVRAGKLSMDDGCAWLIRILRADLSDVARQLFGFPPQPSGGFVILSFCRRCFRSALKEVLPGHAINFWRRREIHNGFGSLFHRDRKASLRKPKDQP